MSEPERPIEKVLRECASKKRETAGADWKLHPVNRRQLHDEIGRTFGSPRARMTWFSWIQRMRWAKPVGALASVAILAAAAWLILDSSRAHKQMLIARNEAANRPLKEAKEQDRSKSQSAPLKKESELALQTPLEQSVIEKKDAEAEALPRSTESVVAQAAPPAMVRSEPQVRSFQAKTPQEASAGTAAMEGSTTPQSIAAAAYSARYGLARDATRGVNPASGPAGAVNAPSPMSSIPQPSSPAPAVTSAAVPPLDLSTVTAMDALKTVSNQTYHFGYFSRAQTLGRQLAGLSAVNQSPGTRSANKVSDASSDGVLTYFRLDQAGNQLRVIDGDNSVYTGQIQLNAPTNGEAMANSISDSSALAERAKIPAQKQTQMQMPSDKYSFQVVGTNRTSQQRVVFSGTLAPALGTSNETSLAVNREQALRLRANLSKDAGVQQTRYISGTALIGGTGPVKIEAESAPAPPPAN